MENEPPNPYAAPAAAAPAVDTDFLKLPSGQRGKYRDNQRLAQVLIGFLVFGAAVHLTRGGLNISYTFGSKMQESIERMMAMTYLTYLICMVIFGVWIVRSAKNAWLFAEIRQKHVAGGNPLGFLAIGRSMRPNDTPGWALGWYFIPIANLWKPYVAMKEIVEASTHKRELPRFILPTWWTLWILASFTEQISRYSTDQTEAWDKVVSAVMWGCYSGVDVALNIIAILLVREVTNLQTQTAVELASSRALSEVETSTAKPSPQSGSSE